MEIPARSSIAIVLAVAFLSASSRSAPSSEGRDNGATAGTSIDICYNGTVKVIPSCTTHVKSDSSTCVSLIFLDAEGETVKETSISVVKNGQEVSGRGLIGDSKHMCTNLPNLNVNCEIIYKEDGTVCSKATFY